jgi:hypothetical protein
MNKQIPTSFHARAPGPAIDIVNCARVGSYALQARSCFAVLIVCAVVQGLEQKYLLWRLVPVFMSAPHSRQTELLVFAVKNQSHLITVGGAFKRVSVARAHWWSCGGTWRRALANSGGRISHSISSLLSRSKRARTRV